MKLCVEKVSWAQCREVFKVRAPDLFRDIEAIDPGKDLYLYRARYPYGSYILNQHAELSLPTDTLATMPVSHPDFPKELAEDLYHNKRMPLALVATGMIQLYRTNPHGGLETHSVYRPGVMLGARSAFPIGKIFTVRQHYMMTSGARTVFFLPSIANATQFAKLRRQFDVKCEKPLDPLDHFKLFRELASHPSFSEPWFTELYFFPKAWHTHLVKEPSREWSLLLKSLLTRTWSLSEYERELIFVNQVWAQFSSGLRNKFLDDYALSVIRHIIEGGLEQLPVYRVYEGDSVPGPFTQIQKIFLESYGMDKFTPIILHLDNFRMSENKEGYISLKMLSRDLPAVADFQNVSSMQYTRLIRYGLNVFLDKLANQEIDLRDTYFMKLLELDHDFFFNTADADQGELKLSSQVFQDNPIVKQLEQETGLSQIPTGTREKFLHSCIRIRKKNLVIK